MELVTISTVLYVTLSMTATSSHPSGPEVDIEEGTVVGAAEVVADASTKHITGQDFWLDTAVESLSYQSDITKE